MSNERDFRKNLRQIHQLGLLAYDLGRRLNQDGNSVFNGWVFLDGSIGIDPEGTPLQVGEKTFSPVFAVDIFLNKNGEGISIVDVFSRFYTTESDEGLPPPLPDQYCLPSNLDPLLLYTSGRLRSDLFEKKLNLTDWQVAQPDKRTGISEWVNCSLKRFDIFDSRFRVFALNYIYFLGTDGGNLLHFNEDIVYEDERKWEESERLKQVIIDYIQKILQFGKQGDISHKLSSVILTPEVRSKIFETVLAEISNLYHEGLIKYKHNTGLSLGRLYDIEKIGNYIPISGLFVSEIKKEGNKIRIIYADVQLHLSDLMRTPLGKIFAERLRNEFGSLSDYSDDSMIENVFSIINQEIGEYEMQYSDEYLSVVTTTAQEIIEDFRLGSFSRLSPLLGFYHEINLDTETQEYEYSFVEKTWSNGRQDFRQGENDGNRVPSRKELVILLNLISSN